MSFTLCTSGAIVHKAGAGSIGTSGALLEEYSDQAEALCNVFSRYDWVTNYATLDANTRGLLAEVCSNLGGVYLVAYNMSGYTSRIEAEDVINVLRDGALRGLQLLRDQKGVKFIQDGA